jgi:LAO/AO transport system kinase
MHELLTGLLNGSYRSLARAISLVENKVSGYIDILLNTSSSQSCPVIGITGPPGAGKSTITDALIGKMVAEDKRVGVLCVDPSSPFNFGALLGDRIRMNQWYNHSNVFIRSLANRGSLGGLHPSIIEITDVMKAFGFDYIIVETVGVGQSEVEIAGLADTTVIVLVPEAGDEVQTMKAGLMEIGDIFVVNKADRPGADVFVRNLKHMLHPSRHSSQPEVPVVKTVADQNVGIDVLFEKIKLHKLNEGLDKHYWLLTEKAYQYIQAKKMSHISKESLFKKIRVLTEEEKTFNLYKFIESFK